MSWYCVRCEEVYPDTETAYGHVCDPVCGKCIEGTSGKSHKETMPQSPLSKAINKARGGVVPAPRKGFA